VPSSVIQAFDYDPLRNELTIVFASGRVYLYSLVSPDKADALRASFSKGAFFNREIRDRYPARQITSGRARRASRRAT
jgi:hypothetical protein